MLGTHGISVMRLRKSERSCIRLRMYTESGVSHAIKRSSLDPYVLTAVRKPKSCPDVLITYLRHVSLNPSLQNIKRSRVRVHLIPSRLPDSTTSLIKNGCPTST